MLNDLLYRLRTLFGGRKMDADVEEELRDHLEREAERFAEQDLLRMRRYDARIWH